MLAGLRSVAAVLVMLMFLVFVFAIIFTMTLAGTAVGHGIFDNVIQFTGTLLGLPCVY